MMKYRSPSPVTEPAAVGRPNQFTFVSPRYGGQRERLRPCRPGGVTALRGKHAPGQMRHRRYFQHYARRCGRYLRGEREDRHRSVGGQQLAQLLGLAGGAARDLAATPREWISDPVVAAIARRGVAQGRADGAAMHPVNPFQQAYWAGRPGGFRSGGRSHTATNSRAPRPAHAIPGRRHRHTRTSRRGTVRDFEIGSKREPDRRSDGIRGFHGGTSLLGANAWWIAAEAGNAARNTRMIAPDSERARISSHL